MQLTAWPLPELLRRLHRATRVMLALVLCLAVVVPARLHAAGAMPPVARHVAMADATAAHPCHPEAPDKAGISASLCMTACACLPAGPVMVPLAVPFAFVVRHAPLADPIRKTGETGGPFRPPRALV